MSALVFMLARCAVSECVETQIGERLYNVCSNQLYSSNASDLTISLSASEPSPQTSLVPWAITLITVVCVSLFTRTEARAELLGLHRGGLGGAGFLLILIAS